MNIERRNRNGIAGWVMALLIVTSAAWADQADDRPGLTTILEAGRWASGEGVARPAEGFLKIWDRGDVTWSFQEDGATIVLSATVVAEGDPSTRWQDLGALPPIGGDGAGRIVVARCPVEAPEIRGDYQTGRQQLIAKGPPVRVPPVVAIVSKSGIDPTDALARIRGRLDTTDAPDDPRRTEARTEHEGVGFESPADLAAWRAEAATIRERLSVTLGLRPAWPTSPLTAHVTRRQERDGYTIEDVVLETMPGFFLAGNLYRPMEATGPCPAILSPHGHYAEGRYAPDVQQRAILWAKHGAVVFSYDMVGYADSRAFGHTFESEALSRAGIGLRTLQTWNSLRALDWIGSLEDVDATRIACTGESGGGTQTYLLTALDDRVRWSAPVVMVSESFQGGCECENGPGLRLGLDNVMVAALAAPRPMILVGATGDWTARTQSHIAPVLQHVYDLYGAGQCFSSVVFDFEHNYNRTSREAVLRFLAPRLLGVLDSSKLTEGEQTIERETDLAVFGEGRPRPEGELTPESLAKRLIEQRQEAVGRLLPGESAATWDVSRREIEAIHRVRVAVEPPSARVLTSYEIRRFTDGEGGPQVVHLEVNNRSNGARIPVTRIEPIHRNAAGSAVVIASASGRAELLDGTGAWSPLVRDLLGRGVTVVGFDPLLVGESVVSQNAQASRPTSRHTMTYNRSLAGDRLQDLATVLTATQATEGIEVVHVVGLGRAGADVLLARPCLKGVGRTYVEVESAIDGAEWPGIDQFGGLAGAGSLVAPSSLWIAGTVDRDPITRAYELAGTPGSLRIEPAVAETEALGAWLTTGTQ